MKKNLIMEFNIIYCKFYPNRLLQKKDLILFHPKYLTQINGI